MQRKSLAIIEQVQKVVSEYDIALSLRQIYYQLVARQIIKNEEKEYRKLSRLCVIARNEELLPEEAFADRLRVVDQPDTWIDLKGFFETVERAYRKSLWQNQPKYIEIWTEKDALRGVFNPITDKYDVPLLVARGQVSRTAIYQASERFKERVKEGKKCHLFYFGDFDPSGLSIYRSLCERLSDMEVAFQLTLEFERIALTSEQIAEYNLPQDPAKRKDPNYDKFVAEYGNNVVELDSLPPDVLQRLIEDTIKSCIDFEKLQEVQKTEKKEKDKLISIISELDY